MKKLYFGTNTKMYKTPGEAEAHIAALRELTAGIDQEKVELFVIPSYTSLDRAVYAAKGRILIGAQNMGWEERAALTGEISPLMLKELGVRLVMIGHSERRHVLHETDQEEEKKVSCAVRNGLRTLVCVGETAEQKLYGVSSEIISIQLKIALHSITREMAGKYLWIAYEPVWAIGETGIPATPEYAEEMHKGIQRTLCELFGPEVGSSIPILYGGSVNNKNAESLIMQKHIDGLFIGRCAWDAKNFNRIIRLGLKAVRKGLKSELK